MGLFSCFTKAGSREPQPSSISSRASHPQGANAPKNDHLKQGKRTQEGQEPDSAQQVAKESLPANALPSPNQQSHQHQEKPAQACCRQPGPPWKSARELALLSVQLAEANGSGSWLARAQASSTLLADRLEACLVSLWAITSDGSAAIVLASAGPCSELQPLGHAVPLTPLAPASSIRLLLADKVPVAWSTDAQQPPHAPAPQPTAPEAPQPPSGTTPHAFGPTATTTSPAAAPSPLPTPDWVRLSACSGAQHFALLPLVSSGVIVGALQICLGPPSRSGRLGTCSRPLLSNSAHAHLTNIALNSHPTPGAAERFTSAATTGGMAHQASAANSAAHPGGLAHAAPHSISVPNPLLPSAPAHPGTGAGTGPGAGAGEGLAQANASNGGALVAAPGTGIPAHTLSARRLHAPPPASKKQPEEPVTTGQQAAGAAAGPGPEQQHAQGTSPVPNWLPHHLPELQQLAVVVALGCFTAVSGGQAGGLAEIAAPPNLYPVVGPAAAAWGAGATGLSGGQGQVAGSSRRLLARAVAMSVTHAARLLATPLHQVVTDMVADLVRAETITHVVRAVMGGLQDLAYRVTQMHFTVTPMLVHRTGTTVAIFQQPAPPPPGAAPVVAPAATAATPTMTGAGAGAAGSGADGPAGSAAGSLPLGGMAAVAAAMASGAGLASACSGLGGGYESAASSQVASTLADANSSCGPGWSTGGPGGTGGLAGEGLRAQITHLNHTLMLQLITGAEPGRCRKLYNGYIMQNCAEYMQDETNRGRDVSLCHRVGVLDTGSLVAVAGMVAPPAQHTPPVPGHTTAPGSAAGGPASIVSPVAPIPLLCAYLTSREPLPESLLEAALAAVHQAFKLILPIIHARFHPFPPLPTAAPSASGPASGSAVPGPGPGPGPSAFPSSTAFLEAQYDTSQYALAEEWAVLHEIHLNPLTVALSTTCTPRSVTRSMLPAAPTSGASLPRAPHSRDSASGAGAGGGGTTHINSAMGLPMPLGAANSMGHAHVGLYGAGLDEGLPGSIPASAHARRSLSFSLAPPAAPAPRSNLGMMVSSIRSSLNAVLSQRASLEAEGLADDVAGVELLKQIGQGGQGVVFCGLLHGLEVAIKVVGTEEGADEVYDIDDEGAMIKLKRVLKRDATELAVTTSISHPNIVQVFSYFVDVMVVEYVGQPDRFKLLPKGGAKAGDGSSVTGPSNMIICMEYCDAGSLKQAVKGGCFRTGPAARNAMQALYTTLMEIALALRHLHSLRLVHCDLKPSNVLLKSSMRDHRGWVCKLSDFGCVRLMAEPAPGTRPTFNLEYAVGTPSFMAPEMFCKGHPLDSAVDIYSFGILMWEVFTGHSVYEGVPADKLPYHVVKRGLRPAFPPETPSVYRSLAQACWASEPRSRPTAAALVTVLQRLLTACAAPQPGVGVGSGVAHTTSR